MRVLSIFAALAFASSSALAADTYNFTVSSPSSTATWSFNYAAPIVTSPSGTSFILGSYNATTNPTGTRTIPGITGGDLNANTPININSGSITASGSSGSATIHPAGAFALTIDTAANTAGASGLTADLLNGSTGSASASVSISYSTFRTRQPTCTILGLPLTVPLGTATLESITATQDGAASGTLSPTGPNTYSVNIPMTVIANASASFMGMPLSVPPTPVMITLTGTLTLNGAAASFTGGFTINSQQVTPGPTPLDPLPFTEPLCSGNLVFTIVLGDANTTVNTSATIAASGTLAPPVCDPDVNQDGVADQGDVDYLINVIAGGDNPTNIDPDFNQDGVADQGDIDALINTIASGTCP
ncbi:MAG: hypothetical protein GC200_11145 [Tepidisphaera sp.]|nr:hypothetical protein [Tepidisphaera sp.]